MKRLSLICGLIAANITAGLAQDEDALTFAGRALKMTSAEPVLGTARYTGMAGAMSALGGDGAALKDNPAALGIYRKSDIGITPNVNIDNEGNGSFNINNFSTAFNFGRSGNSSGYVTSTLGISYNRLANFNRTTYTSGSTGFGDRFYNSFYENNGSGIWNFAYGLNISNKFYAGLSVNALTLSYKQKTQIEIGDDWEDNIFETEGSGCNLALGVIVKPTNFLRIGASITSPSWLNMHESAEYPLRDADGNLQYDKLHGQLIYAGYGFDYSEEAKYKVQAPWKGQLGLGFVLGKRALIGLDYAYQNYSSLKLKDDGGHEFRDTKAFTDDNYKAVHTLKLGTEVQIAKGFAVRAGFAHQSSPTEDLCSAVNDKHEPNKNHGLYVPYNYESVLYSYAIPREANYFTLGAGYHGKVFYCDLAYAQKNQKEDFYDWQEMAFDRNDEWVGWAVDPLEQTIKTRNIMLTLGVKF